MVPELEERIATLGLAPLLAAVRERLDDDPGHDLAHCLRVARWTITLGGAEVDPREAIAAALLHDVVNVPKDSPQRAKASELSADVARTLLPAHGFDEAAIDRIAGAIRDHSFSRGAVPETTLGRALQDADRLEALGALGLLRLVSTGARMGSRYLHPEDPWAEARPLDDARYMIDHVFRKLFLLAGTMRTEAGRAEAARRTEFLRAFVRQLGHEIGATPSEDRLGEARSADPR
jgi:uncharacterized protein